MCVCIYAGDQVSFPIPKLSLANSGVLLVLEDISIVDAVFLARVRVVCLFLCLSVVILF